MAGDKKGKGKHVVQQKKKRTREDREQERAEAVADAANRQGSLRIRDPQAQGELQRLLHHSGRTQTAQTTPESRSRPRTRRGGTHRAAGRDSERERQLVRIVMQRRSLHRLSCLIFGAFQDLGSRD